MDVDIFLNYYISGLCISTLTQTANLLFNIESTQLWITLCKKFDFKRKLYSIRRNLKF